MLVPGDSKEVKHVRWQGNKNNMADIQGMSKANLGVKILLGKLTHFYTQQLGKCFFL